MKLRKYGLLLLACLLFLGCQKRTVPKPEVEAFLNTELSGIKAFEAVEQVDYILQESWQDAQGQELGSSHTRIGIEKKEGQSLSLHMHTSYTGSYVREGIEEAEQRLYYENGGYMYYTSSNGEEKTEPVEESFARDLVTSFFYTQNEAYCQGGLYYGDYFLLHIYDNPAESFSVEENCCVFDQRMVTEDRDIGEIRFHQRSVINPLGLLVENTERYESIEKGTVLVSTLSALYEVKP